MTAWLIIAIIVIWIFLSATLLVSLCMLSSRFNQSESQLPEEPISSIGPARESWFSQEGTPNSTTYISMQ